MKPIEACLGHESSRIKQHLVILMVVWSLVVLLSFGWHLFGIRWVHGECAESGIRYTILNLLVHVLVWMLGFLGLWQGVICIRCYLRKRCQTEEELVSQQAQLKYLAEECAHDLAQEKHKQGITEEALHDSGKVIETLLNATTDFIYLIDENLSFIELNEAMAAQLGSSRNHLRGRCLFDFFPAEVAKIKQARIEEALRTRKPLRFNDQRQEVWLSHSIFPILGQQGKVVAAAVFTKDISEQKRQEIELVNAIEKAESANRAKNVFLANMNHELRTLLNCINGMTQLMLRDQSLTDQQRKNLSMLSSSGEHLMNIIQQILQMSKMEFGRMEVNETPCDLSNLLQTLEMIVGIRAAKKGLKLNMVLKPNAPRYIKTDTQKLSQILLNLLENAVQFTSQGLITLTVYLSDQEATVAAGERFLVNFSVEDTGPGIPPDDMQAVFEPFFQSQANIYKSEGIGLRLAICQKFVKLLGGDIDVINRPGKGATFCFFIKAEMLENPPEIETISLSPIPLPPNLSCYKILAVDDEIFNRLTLEQMLKSVYLTVKSVSNGQEAVEIFRVWRPHLILMDIKMPGMDGFEAARKIREIEAVSLGSTGAKPALNTPIIALTALTFEDARPRALTENFCAVAAKPIIWQQLLELILKQLKVMSQADVFLEAEPEALTYPQIISAFTEFSLDVRAELRKDIIEGRRKRIIVQIETIRARHPRLGHLLAEMADAFKYKDILRFLDEAAGKDGTP